MLAPTNAAIGAASSAVRFAIDGDYANAFANFDERASVPHYQEAETARCTAAGCTRLGYGVATAMRGDTIVGYAAEVSSGGSDSQSHQAIAMRWTQNRAVSLGAGIAYAVDAAGDVVGDDGAESAARGKPTLWKDGRAIRLGENVGSALGIADDGTIVGTVGDAGFVVEANDPSHRMRDLTTLLRARGWTIDAAYGIANNGRILAQAHRTGGTERFVILDPR